MELMFFHRYSQQSKSEMVILQLLNHVPVMSVETKSSLTKPT
jgi:hypothetical protein